MLMERIDPEQAWGEHVLVRLFRRWAAAREAGIDSRMSIVALAAEIGRPAMVAVALDSLLQLTECCLGRPLQAECCCSRSLSADERALMMMIRAARPSPAPFAAADVPHGLPGALTWAALSLRYLIGDRFGIEEASPPLRCPFAR